MKLLNLYKAMEDVSVWKRSDRNFFVRKNGTKKLVKLVTLDTIGKKQFIQLDDIPNIRFLTTCDTVVYEGEVYEIHEINPAISHADLKCFRKLLNIYDYHSNIMMLSPYFRGVGWYTDEIAHTHIVHYSESLGDVVLMFKNMTEGLAKDVLNCTKGFFHGDLHYGNIMTDGKRLHIIDFENVEYSYVVLNLAMPFYIEVFARYRDGRLSLEEYRHIRKLVGDALAPADAASFNFFVLMMGFYWNTRLVPTQIEETELRKQVLSDRTQSEYQLMMKLI